jgi:hypothetical protein
MKRSLQKQREMEKWLGEIRKILKSAHPDKRFIVTERNGKITVKTNMLRKGNIDQYKRWEVVRPLQDHFFITCPINSDKCFVGSRWLEVKPITES